MKRNNFFILVLCILFAFLFSSCGINEEDIVLKTPKQICSEMNKRFDEEFTIVKSLINDGPDYKGTSVTLTTPTFPEEKIIAMYGYYHSIFGWRESNKSNYNYFHFKDELESKYTDKIKNYLADIKYKAVNASQSENVYDEIGKTNNLEEYLKEAGSSINYYICINENNNAEDIINSIKKEMQKNVEPVHFYFFLVSDVDSLTEEAILTFNSNQAFDDSFKL